MTAEVFVGRDAELATLADQLSRAAEGKGRFVLISGEPGIGKTRLAEEMSRIAEQRGHLVAWGRSWEGPGTPAYWPWLQILRALGIADAITQGSADLDQHEARFRMFDSIGQRLVRAAADKPIAIVLDDVHAADMSTLLLLHFVARTVQRTRLLVIATSRDNWFHSSPQSSELLAKIAREALSLPLGRLGEEDVTRWVTTIAPQLASKTERVVEASEGNPLFVEELVAAARKRPDVGWASSQEMPHGVREAVRAHLALLSPETTDVLATVAVLGREVSRAAAVALAGNDVGAAIDEGVRLGVLIHAADDRVRFAHVLMRDELYGGLALERRGELHRAIAKTAEPAVAAHHYLLGARREDAATALAAAQTAIEHATAQLALEDAAALGQRAVDVLGPYLEPEAACELHIRVAEACQIAGRIGPARALSDRAIELGIAIGDATRVARATLVLASMNSLGRDEKTLARLRGALALLPATPSPLRAQLMGRLSTCMVPSPPHEAPEQAAMREQSIAMARELGDEATLFTVLRLAALVFPEMMPVKERLALHREALALSDRLSRLDASQTVMLVGGHVNCHLELGDLEGARAEVAAAERRIAAVRRPNLQWRAPLLRATLASLVGEFAEAAALIDQAIELGKQHEMFEALLMSGIARTTVQYARGDDVGYAGYYELGLDTQLKAGAPGPYKAILYAAAFDVEKTRAALDFSIGVPVDVMPGSSMLAMSALRVGLDEHALRLYRVGREHFGKIAMVGAPSGTGGPTSLILGRLATLAGDHADADRYFQQSLELCERLTARPFSAQTQLAWARSLAARGQGDAARKRGDAARSIAEALGMHRVADEAAALIGAAAPTRTAPPASRAAPAALALARDGEMWTLSLGATSIRMVDSKGLAYLEVLMRDPGREVHVLDLVGIESAGDAGPVLDAKAKQMYRARAQELKETLEEAIENNDLGRAEAAREELEALEEELARAVGLGGRDRRAVSQAERARINVQRRLRDVIRRATQQDAELGRQLERSLTTGLFCSYAP